MSHTTPVPKPVRAPKAKPQGLKRTAMKRKRTRRIDRETPAEKHWKQWIHTKRCVGEKSFPDHVCSFGISPFYVVQQAHFRDHTGASLKEDNFKSLPMCYGLHYDYDNTRGEFAQKGLEGKKQWFLCRLIEVRADFELEHGCCAEEWPGT